VGGDCLVVRFVGLGLLSCKLRGCRQLAAGLAFPWASQACEVAMEEAESTELASRHARRPQQCAGSHPTGPTWGSRRAGCPTRTIAIFPFCRASRSTRLSTATLEAAQASTRLQKAGEQGAGKRRQLARRLGRGGADQRSCRDRDWCWCWWLVLAGQGCFGNLMQALATSVAASSQQHQRPAASVVSSQQGALTCRAPPPGR
jgi:hypothetical protein